MNNSRHYTSDQAVVGGVNLRSASVEKGLGTMTQASAGGGMGHG